MSGIALNLPWDSQPQEAVEVDDYWRARGLAFAVIPGQAEVLSKSLPVLSGSSSFKVNLAGRAFASPDTQIPGAFTYAVNIPSSFDNTVIVVVRSTVGQGVTVAVPTLHFNSAESVLFSTSGSQTVYSTTGNGSTTITTLTVGETYALAGVKRVNSQEQWVNGVKSTTNVTGNRAIVEITSVSVGRPSGGNNLEKVEYAGIFYFTWALSEREIAHLTSSFSSVWQLFAPRQIWIPASAASALPTLSNPTAINITASSFQPRVSYAF